MRLSEEQARRIARFIVTNRGGTDVEVVEAWTSPYLSETFVRYTDRAGEQRTVRSEAEFQREHKEQMVG